MRDRIDQLIRFCRSPLGVKLFRYVMGSVITTVVSFGVLTVVYGVLGWWGAVPSTVFANVVATIPAYWLNRTWTWGKVGRSDPWREVIPFWVLSVLGIVISMGTAEVAAGLAHSHHFGHLLTTVVVDGANLAAYGILFVGKYVVFQRLFRAAEAVRSARVPATVPASAVADEPVPATVGGGAVPGLLHAGRPHGSPGQDDDDQPVGQPWWTAVPRHRGPDRRGAVAPVARAGAGRLG